MLKGRELLSLPVVTMERKQMGEVKDIVCDHSRKVVLGYLVDTGGWLRDGKGFLHSDLVRREEDCLVINDESVVKKVSMIPELKEALNKKNDLRGLPVEFADGRSMGIIQDLVVNGETGEIAGYEVSDGIIQDLLDGRVTIPCDGISVNQDKAVALSAIDFDPKLKGESI